MRTPLQTSHSFALQLLAYPPCHGTCAELLEDLQGTPAVRRLPTLRERIGLLVTAAERGPHARRREVVAIHLCLIGRRDGLADSNGVARAVAPEDELAQSPRVLLSLG